MVSMSNPRCACTRVGGVNASHFMEWFSTEKLKKHGIELTLLRLMSSKIARGLIQLDTRERFVKKNYIRELEISRNRRVVLPVFST